MNIKKLIITSFSCLSLMMVGAPSLNAVSYSFEDAKILIFSSKVSVEPETYLQRSTAFGRIINNLGRGIYSYVDSDDGVEPRSFSGIKDMVMRDSIKCLNELHGDGSVGLLDVEAILIRRAENCDELINNLRSLAIAYSVLSN